MEEQHLFTKTSCLHSGKEREASLGVQKSRVLFLGPNFSACFSFSGCIILTDRKAPSESSSTTGGNESCDSFTFPTLNDRCTERHQAMPQAVSSDADNMAKLKTMESRHVDVDVRPHL